MQFLNVSSPRDRRFGLGKVLASALVSLALWMHGSATAEQLPSSTNAGDDPTLTSSSTTGSASKNDSPPVIVIKNNTAVASTQKGWVVGAQNGTVSVQAPAGDGLQGVGAVSVTQNPTGGNVQSNASSLSQPPTLLVSLPTCVDTQTLVGDTCQCPAGTTFNSATQLCVTTCTPPATTVSHPSCGSGFSGTKTVTTTWSCPSPTGSPVSNTTTDSSSCVAVAPPCTPPATTVSHPACDAGYTGTKTVTTTWSCPGPTSNTTTSTSGCTACGTTVTQRTVACSGGQVGNVVYNDTKNACTGQLISSTVASSSCSCPAGFTLSNGICVATPTSCASMVVNAPGGGSGTYTLPQSAIGIQVTAQFQGTGGQVNCGGGGGQCGGFGGPITQCYTCQAGGTWSGPSQCPAPSTCPAQAATGGGSCSITNSSSSPYIGALPQGYNGQTVSQTYCTGCAVLPAVTGCALNLGQRTATCTNGTWTFGPTAFPSSCAAKTVANPLSPTVPAIIPINVSMEPGGTRAYYLGAYCYIPMTAHGASYTCSWGCSESWARLSALGAVCGMIKTTYTCNNASWSP